MQLNRCIPLACVLIALLASSSMAQSNNRTRDRQSRTRNTSNRPGQQRSSGQFTSKNLPAEFAILRTRSIFSRDRMAAAAADNAPRDPRPRTNDRPSSPVFRGVINESGNHIAGIERGTAAVAWYREGQSIGNGDKITQISLDQLTITMRNGDRRIVPVGERIDAGTAVARDPGKGSPTTQPTDERFSRRDDDNSDE